MTTIPERYQIASHCAVIGLCVGVLVCAVWLTVGAERVMDGGNMALATVNKPKSGTLSMIDDTILQARLTIDATNKVLIHEQSQLDTFDDYGHHLDVEISSLAAHSDTTLDALTGTATTASTSLQTLTADVTPVLDTTKSTIADAGTAITTQSVALSKSQADFQKVLTDFEPVEANAVSITGSGADMMNVADKKFELFMNPPPCRDWKCHIGQTIEIMKTASSFVEPAFYLKEIFTGQQIFGTVTVQQPKGTP